MNVFHESDLVFSFPDDWEVKKFDQTRFFKRLCGEGFKGVDFIIITPEEKLILLEVKNYSGDWEIDGVSPTQNLINTLPIFSNKIIHKFEDTFHIIKIIQKVYQRKWWFWLLDSLLRRSFSFSNLIKKEWGFWTVANELLQNKDVELILCLKVSDEISEERKQDIYKKIKNGIQSELNEFHFHVAANFSWLKN